jgi:asparagine synthase (glutamine-hydrolysing)
MCGITGIFSMERQGPNVLENMTDALAHRGPDAHGYFCKDSISLGHRRLSIIDLDARANQPFLSQDGRYVIVFNGEIYNFKKIASDLSEAGITLRTTSDTEVVIEAFALWGTGFVHKLQGMFAFVIYDLVDEKLFLYRDRVGKKPLYYYLSNGLFVFASEIKALMQHPVIAVNKKINKATIGLFLQLGYIPQPNTFYKSISKFPAGHYAIIDKEFQLTIFPYWNITHYLKTSRKSDEPLAFKQLKDLIHQAVTSRLVADVPVGIFLSGGIDSSLVTAVASKSAKLKTFSIGFEENKFDESVHAKKIAQHLGTHHYQYILKERDAVEMVDQYLEHFDEPFADTSSIPTMLVSKLAREEVTVALTGDGGDELFMGYGAYAWADRLANPFWSLARPTLEVALSNMPSSRWKRVSRMFERVPSQEKRQHIFSQEQYFFSTKEVKNAVLIRPELNSDLNYNDLQHLAILSEAERQALFDFQFYLRDDLLVKVDRASMYYGLECRCPLLDHNLVEFTSNLPISLRKKGSTSKYLLKKMLYEMVPEKYFDRPKWGFSIPLGKWMKNELSYLMKYVEEEELIKTGVFNVNYVKSLKERFYKGEEYLYNRLWAVIIIQKYLLKNHGLH